MRSFWYQAWSPLLVQQYCLSGKLNPADMDFVRLLLITSMHLISLTLALVALPLRRCIWMVSSVYLPILYHISFIFALSHSVSLAQAYGITGIYVLTISVMSLINRLGAQLAYQQPSHNLQIHEIILLLLEPCVIL